METILIVILVVAVLALILSPFIDVDINLEVTKKKSPIIWYKPTTWLEFKVDVSVEKTNN